MMHTTTRSRSPRWLLVVALLALGACGEQGTAPATLAARDFDDATTCVLDGMLLAEHAGPKAQIFYADATEPAFFCDTVEMFNVLLKPEQVRKVNAVFVQDMGAADWARPRGHWIDARNAFYVVGSSQRGSMGPTIGAFADAAQARAFAGQYGGQVHPYQEVTADMAVLDGGVLHDAPM